MENQNYLQDLQAQAHAIAHPEPQLIKLVRQELQLQHPLMENSQLEYFTHTISHFLAIESFLDFSLTFEPEGQLEEADRVTLSYRVCYGS